MKMNGSW